MACVIRRRWGLVLAIAVGIGAQDSPEQPKSHRTLHSNIEIDEARKRATPQEIENIKKNLEWVLQKSDEELWNFVPPYDQVRAINVHYSTDCPKHGKAIHQIGGHYPWIMTRELPFKVKCPIGGEIYPTNDFVPWHHGGQEGKIDKKAPYIDDGRGWVSPEGETYWFVAHYIFWRRWRDDILSTLPSLGEAYLLTDDLRYAHKAAILLARIASEYPKMNYTQQAYHGGKFPNIWPGGILDRIWETGVVEQCATAYDAIRPTLSQDTVLAAFLKKREIPDAASHIEANLLQDQARRLLAGTIMGNMGMHQKAAMLLAIVLDNKDSRKGITSQELVDFVLHGSKDPKYPVAFGGGMGGMEDLLDNSVYPDGAGGESSPGYSALWAASFYEIAELLQRYGIDLFKHPKMKRLAQFWIELSCAGSMTPDIGDSGTIHGGQRVGWNPQIFDRAFRRYRDPEFARVLHAIKAKALDRWHEPSEAEVREAVTKTGEDLVRTTRNLGGYGLAILESGAGTNRRALALYYGYSGGGHGHRDRLNVESWAYGRPILTDMGYPATWLDKTAYWTNNTISHYGVIIDRHGQENRFAGQLLGLAGMPGTQWVEASADVAYAAASLYRRSTALIDLDAERSYVFDVFRVHGGAQHDWSFHGPAFGEFSSQGIEFSKAQSEGTLAGAEVPFGQPYGEKDSGFQYLFNVLRGKASQPWSVTWKIPPEGKAEAMGLRVWGWPSSSGATELIAADSEPEQITKTPKEMKFLLQRRIGKDLGSVFAVVAEPFRGTRVVRAVHPIALSKAEGEPVVVRIEHERGEDWVACGLENAEARGEGIEFAGRFGRLSMGREQNALALRGICLAHGARISDGRFTLEAVPWKECSVERIDLKNNTIRVAGGPPKLAPFVGCTVVIRNKKHGASYTVDSVDGRTLGFGDIRPVVARGVVAKVEKRKIRTNTRLIGYGRVYGGRFDGMRLANENGSRAFLIDSVKEGEILLDASEQLTDQAFQDSNRDGKIEYQVIDFGVGDAVQFPSFVGVAACGEGKYEWKATCPFTVTVPGRVEVEGVTPGQVKTAANGTSISIDAEHLGSGVGTFKLRIP